MNNQIALKESFNDVYVTPAHTKKDFTNMKRQNKDFSGIVTPLFDNMLVPSVVEGEGLGQPSKPQPPSSTTPLEQVLTVDGDEAVYTGEDSIVVRAATTTVSLEADQESGQLEHQDDLTDVVPPTPHDSPLSRGHTPGSDEGRPNINELMNIYNKLSNKVLALEQFKTAQDLVIKRLEKKVKRMEKKQRARTSGMKLFKVGTSKKKTLDKENVSKQGRNESNRIVNLSDNGSGETKVFDYTNAAEPVSTAGDAVNAASVIHDVSDAGPFISADGPSTSTAKDIFKDEMTTMVDTLNAIGRTRPRTTSVVIYDVEEEQKGATLPPTVQSQDKESSKKRSRADHDKESVKKQKLEEDDAKKEELRACLDIVPVDDIAINIESLATKYPIVD
uniref:Uncharacterized protein n=1 Tax=Tanacetum cinerariifolium TaxID=118510 RepID=A0A6L2JEM4_TANCI|nr:hypothetical protein [Tanacetum cinerariifolium]